MQQHTTGSSTTVTDQVPLRHSLRFRLALLTCGLVLATAGVLLTWAYSDLAGTAKTQQMRELQILGGSAAARIDQLTRSAEEPLDALMRETDFRIALRLAARDRDAAARDRLQDEIVDVAEAESGFSSLQVYDVSGLPLAGVIRQRKQLMPRLREYSFTGEPEALQLARRLPVGEASSIGPLVREAEYGRPAISLDIAMPVFDDRGTRIGVVLGEYDLTGLVDAVGLQAADRSLTRRPGFVLVDIYGNASGDALATQIAGQADAIRALLDRSPVLRGGTWLRIGPHRVAVAAAALTAHGSDPGRYSFVAFTATEAALLGEVHIAFIRRLVAAGFLVGGAMLAALLFAGSLVSPLESLLEAARRFGTGEPVGHLPVGRRDEVGRLGVAFALAVGQADERSKDVQREMRMRQQTEDELREKAQRLEASESRFRALYEGVAAGVCVMSTHGRILSANPAFVRLTGHPTERSLQQPDVAAELWAGPGTLEEYLKAVRQEGELTAFERRIRRLDGRMVWVLENVRAVWDGDGNVERYESTCVDISDRKHAEYAQRASELRFRRLSDSNVIGVVFGSLATGLVTEVNHYVLRLLGYQPSDLPVPLGSVLSHDWRDVIDAVRSTGHLRQPLAPLEKTLRRRDGSEVPVLVSVTLVDPHGDEFVAAIVDRSSAVQSLREIRELKEFFHVVLDSIPIRVAYVDREERVRFFNRAYLDWYGTTASRVEGRRLVEVIGRDRYDSAAANMRRALAGEPCRYEASVERDGRSFHADIFYVPHRDESGEVVGFFSVAHDVSEARELESRLRQSQRLEAVGQLTGGIAHDFNNLLSVIIGNLQLQERQLGPADRSRRPLEAALRAALRGAELTARLLSFSRQQPLAPRVIDVAGQVATVLTLVERTLGPSIEVVTRVPGDLWPVAMDAGQFDNAVLNLAINARDAMEGVGELTISASNLVLGPGDIRQGEEARPGEYVCIAVSDTGHGMTPEVRARAFEPFYTTKAIGKGSGLGLAMVYGFVHQSGGVVRLASQAGQGTTVELLFPRASATGFAPARTPATLPAPRGGGETILVVEDDADVRDTVTAMLKDLGYAVLAAADGPAALEALGRHPVVDLMLTDVAMPGGLRGPELAAEARRRLPRLRTLLTTGFADAREFRRAGVDPAAVLWKPYAPGDLAHRVRAALEEPPPGIDAARA